MNKRLNPLPKFFWLFILFASTLAYSTPGKVRARPAQSFDEFLGRQFIQTADDRDEHNILNLRKAQKAAENYASHNKGKYPIEMNNAFKSYFPLGNQDGKNYSTFTILYNPYTKKPIWPVVSIDNSPHNAGLPGAIEYQVFPKTNSYAIYGRGADGKLLKEGKQKIFKLTSNKAQIGMANARTVQWAAERYNERMKRYPIGVTNSFKFYFPKGNPQKKLPGNQLLNPYTGKLTWPITGKLKDLKRARNSKPGQLTSGAIEYSCLENGKNYAIRIGGDGNYALSGHNGSNSTLIYARDGDGLGHERKF